jgi:tRNA (guanine-N7-)-methyltransferase
LGAAGWRSRRPEGALLPPEVPTVLPTGASTELEVEIGMGNGHFLTEYARRHPDRFLLGIERKRHRVVRALKKLETGSLSNARVVLGGAEAVLEVLPPSSVAAFHIYFLDPWPKTRHRKRRFLRHTIVDTLLTALRPGGRICFATDMLDYYVQAKILFLLGGAVSTASEPPEETHLSVYSARFRDTGTRTYYLVARKPMGPAANCGSLTPLADLGDKPAETQ